MKENQNVEWKESWNDDYLKWICGFANAQGGTLVIGKNDRGVTTGLKESAKLLEVIPNKVRDILGIIVQVNLKGKPRKEYLEIVVEPHPYPVSYKGEYHYRSGSTKQELKGAPLDLFLLKKQGRHWDGVPVPHVSHRDLDKGALTYFRKRALNSRRLSPEILEETDSILMEKLHLMDGHYLKRAAVLLFHPDPEMFVTGAFVKIGYFQNNTDLLYQDEIHGDLFSQVNKTLDLLLTKYTKALISYEGIHRVETYPVPKEALREALLNAVAHKDYASATPIQISVYEDKIMMWNPGQLPQDWTIDKLKGKHPSEPFNPDIANTFFRAGMIEAWGRGIERIVDSCRTADAHAPLFRFEQTGLWIEFRFNFKPKTNNKETTTQETTQETAQETAQEKILELLKSNPSITRRVLASQVGLSEDGVKYHLNKLKSAGRIKHKGSTKTGYWEVSK